MLPRGSNGCQICSSGVGFFRQAVAFARRSGGHPGLPLSAFNKLACVWMARVASLATIALSCIGIIRKIPLLLAISSIPLLFLFLHAVTVLTEVRYAFLAYHLLFGNSVVLVSLFTSRKYPIFSRQETLDKRPSRGRRTAHS